MQELYRALGDDAQVEESGQHVRRLLAEMDLFCGVCNKPMGDKNDRLEALQCCHIVHARWVIRAFSVCHGIAGLFSVL